MRLPGAARDSGNECRLSAQGRVSSLLGRSSVVSVFGACSPEYLVVIERRWRCSVTRRAARRAEREALDRRRAGATGGCVRAGAHAYLGPRPAVRRAGDMMVMG